MTPNIYWHLPPLVLATSLVYAASRHEDPRRIARKALYWCWYILQFLGVTFLVVWGAMRLGERWWQVFGPVFAAWWLFGRWRRRREAAARAAEKSPA